MTCVWKLKSFELRHKHSSNTSSLKTSMYCILSVPGTHSMYCMHSSDLGTHLKERFKKSSVKDQIMLT